MTNRDVAAFYDSDRPLPVRLKRPDDPAECKWVKQKGGGKGGKKGGGKGGKKEGGRGVGRLIYGAYSLPGGTVVAAGRSFRSSFVLEKLLSSPIWST